MTTLVKKRDSAIAWHSNEFLSAAYSMTRDEKRVLWLCMSAVEPGEPEGTSFEISVKQYAAMFDVSPSDASKDLRGALTKLLGRSITIYLPDESTEEEEAYDQYSILLKTANRPKRGLYQLELNPYLLQFFKGLKREFTKLRLLEVAELRNPHAMRLYENLIQYESTSVFCRRVDWFIERYQLPASYGHYGLFKSKFLNPCVAEINKKTPLSVGYKENKVGRRVVSINFSFSRKLMEGGI